MKTHITQSISELDIYMCVLTLNKKKSKTKQQQQQKKGTTNGVGKKPHKHIIKKTLSIRSFAVDISTIHSHNRFQAL